MDLGKSLYKFVEDTFLDLCKSEGLNKSKLLKSKLYASEPAFGRSPEIKNALKLRIVLFKVQLTRDLEADYGLYKSSQNDFAMYLDEHMKKYFPYPCMSIFDKLLMSCVVLTRMACICHARDNDVYQFVGPESLAINFKQEHGNEFLEEGGWGKLQEYASEFYIFDGKDLMDMSGYDDLTKSKKCLDIIGKTCNIDGILELFKQRTKFNNDKQCCCNCFPLFDLLNSLTRRSTMIVGDFQLIEGYLQLFRRVDMKRRDDSRKEIKQAKEGEKKSVGVKAQCKIAYTKILQKNIFPSLNDDGTWKPLEDPVSERCLLCGKEMKVKSVPYIKSIYRRAAFEIEDKEIKDNVTLKTFLKGRKCS